MLKTIVFAALVAAALSNFIDYSPNARLLLTYPASNNRNEPDVVYIPSVYYASSAASSSRARANVGVSSNTRYIPNDVRASNLGFTSNAANAARSSNVNTAQSIFKSRIAGTPYIPPRVENRFSGSNSVGRVTYVANNAASRPAIGGNRVSSARFLSQPYPVITAVSRDYAPRAEIRAGVVNSAPRVTSVPNAATLSSAFAANEVSAPRYVSDYGTAVSPGEIRQENAAASVGINVGSQAAANVGGVATNARYVSDTIRATNLVSAANAANKANELISGSRTAAISFNPPRSENDATAANIAAKVTYAPNYAELRPATSANGLPSSRFDSQLSYASTADNRDFASYNFASAARSGLTAANSANQFVPRRFNSEVGSATNTLNQVYAPRQEAISRGANSAVKQEPVPPTPAPYVAPAPVTKPSNGSSYEPQEASPGYASEVASATNTINRVYGSNNGNSAIADYNDNTAYDSIADYGAYTDYNSAIQPGADRNAAFFSSNGRQLNVVYGSNADYYPSVPNSIPNRAEATPIVENNTEAPIAPSNIRTNIDPAAVISNSIREIDINRKDRTYGDPQTTDSYGQNSADTRFGPNRSNQYDSHTLASFVRPPATAPDNGAKLAFNQGRRTSAVNPLYRF